MDWTTADQQEMGVGSCLKIPPPIQSCMWSIPTLVTPQLGVLGQGLVPLLASVFSSVGRDNNNNNITVLRGCILRFLQQCLVHRKYFEIIFVTPLMDSCPKDSFLFLIKKNILTVLMYQHSPLREMATSVFLSSCSHFCQHVLKCQSNEEKAMGCVCEY